MFIFRRKELKDAVCSLRNQLRKPTKKPSTISVLKAAKEEIEVGKLNTWRGVDWAGKGMEANVGA